MGGVVARMYVLVISKVVLTVQRIADRTAMWFAMKHGHHETEKKFLLLLMLDLRRVSPTKVMVMDEVKDRCFTKFVTSFRVISTLVNTCSTLCATTQDSLNSVFPLFHQF